jgi:hypothetical protein
MASSQSWPFDDEDRPSGSVRPLSQADLQAVLAYHNDDPEELLAGTGADRPVVAARVRASVGRPGGSAQARWRQERATEWAVWTRGLPWRVAAIVGVGPAAESLAACWRLGWDWSSACWRPWRLAAGCGSGPAPMPSPGGGGRPGSDAPPGSWLRWSARAGRSCTTWPSPAARPTSTTW